MPKKYIPVIVVDKVTKTRGINDSEMKTNTILFNI
jgi:hypothetical protein